LLIAANTEYVIPDNFVDTIKELVRVGMDMAGAFLEIANTFTGIVTPAATQAAQAMDMASKFIKDVYDLGKQMVKEPPTFPTNFRALIQQLVQMGKDIAVAFIEEADTFATNVGPGAVALLDVYGKMDDFFKGFNKAVLAVQAIESVPTDAPAKVASIMAIATQMAQNYITAANSFEGVKGEGATNLENILGKFATLTKNVKDILKTLEDWGTAEITSDSIAPALALFASVLNTFATQSEGAGTTAGGGFMTAFAQAIRDNASQVYDALREVLAGAQAIIPGGGSGGGGGGGGGQGAGATLAGANTGTPTSSGANSGLEAAVAAGVERGMKAAQRANELEQQAKNGGAQQNVTVNLGTAMGLDSTLTLLMNMAKG
jgi:hypothetical protein